MREGPFEEAAKHLKDSIGGSFNKYHSHDENYENNVDYFDGIRQLTENIPNEAFYPQLVIQNH